MTLPLALDAMGGDHAPREIIEGARRARDEHGVESILVGIPELLGDTHGFEVFPCTEVIEMDDDPGSSVRKKKDSSLVRAAELVRDGKARAMVSAGNTGATTVASTMRLAHMAGIRVFATGGIGGVHRGAETTMDISADLTELSVTPVAVVSAGVKSILDIRLTLEHLETMGVPVVVNGSDDFPSFFSRTSGLPAPRRVDGPAEIAKVMNAAWHQLGLSCGVSVANPVPVEFEVPASEISGAIEQALADLRAQGIEGQDVTPFLLDRMRHLTEGESVTANRALLVHNAVGDQLTCVFVDHGLLRLNEGDMVMDMFEGKLHARVIRVDASDLFLGKLAGVSDPEHKRKIIGGLFVDVFKAEAAKLKAGGQGHKGATFLAQGTIYPDVVESSAPDRNKAQRIKTHHAQEAAQRVAMSASMNWMPWNSTMRRPERRARSNIFGLLASTGALPGSVMPSASNLK